MNTKKLIRKILVYALYIILFTCLQVTYPDLFTYFGQTGDLMLIFVVFVSYFFGFWDGFTVALIVGVLRDYFSSPSYISVNGESTSSFGIGMLTMLVISVISSSIFSRRVNRKVTFSFLTLLIVSFLYKIVGHIVNFVYIRFFTDLNYGLDMYDIVISSILPSVFLNMVFSIPVLLLVRFLGPYSKGINPKLIDEYSVEGDELWLKI